MTDKEIIKAEIERLKEENSIGLSEYDAGFCNAVGETCRKLLSFINSLPEEPVSEDLTEEFNRFLDNEEGMPRMWHPDEQLEWGKDIARHFAQWQREQMMKDAYDATVGEGNPGVPQFGESIPIIENGDMILLPKSFKYGEKIKVIVIKEA